MSSAAPLVSIGIPTYNRAALVGRAIRSALGQDHPNIEILISDNASTDGTAEICERHARADARIHFQRQPANAGPTPNFIAVLQLAQGEYFMWLGDDDWIDPDYVSRMLRQLQADPQVALASGTPVYYVHGERQRTGLVFSIDSPHRLSRILRYYWNVEDNGTFYGLMRRSDILQTPLPNLMGGDWFFVANFAARGNIVMLDGTHVHRELGGATASHDNIARALGLAHWHARFPFVSMAGSAFRDVLHHGSAFRQLPWCERLWVGTAASGCIVAKGAWQQMKVRMAGLKRRWRHWAGRRELPNHCR